MKKNLWVGDLESNGLLDEATVIHCGVFKNYHTKEKVYFTPENITGLIAFLDTVDELIIHNGLGFDKKLLKKILDYDFKGKIFDTLVASRTLSPNRRLPKECHNKRAGPHSLEAWGYRVGRGKPEYDEWEEYDDEMLHRCDEDVEINVLVYDVIQAEMKCGDWTKAMPLTQKLFEITEKMQDYGWLVDQDWMDECIITLEDEFDKIDKEVIPSLPYIIEVDLKSTEVKKPFIKSGHYSSQMFEWFANTSTSFYDMMDRVESREVAGPFCRVLPRQVDLTSRKEMIELLLNEGWIPDEWNIDKKTKERTSPKLSYKDKFVGIEGKVGKLAARRVQIRHRHSLIKGLYKHIRPDGRIGQRVTGLAVTGRAKHSAIVNIPNSEAYFGKELRKIFTVPDGKVLIGVDSDSCQNRMLAARVNDPEFTKTILEGTKEGKTTIHFVNQRVLKEVGYDVSYGMSKNIGYAFNFGASDTKLGSMVRGTKDDGTKVRAALLSVSAGLETLLNNLRDGWEHTALKRKGKWGKWNFYNGILKGLDGRPIHVESPHALLVYQLQSDEAILMTYAYLYLYKWCNEKGWTWGEDWAYVGWNHDEFQCEVNPEIADEFSKLASRSIEYAGKVLKINIPHIGDADQGRTWLDTH